MIRAILAGLAFAGAAAPHDRWYLAIAGMALLYSTLRNKRRLSRMVRAFATYVVMFGFTLAWTDQFTLAGRIALSLGEAVLLAIPLLLLPRKQPIYGPVAFVGLITITEAVRQHIPWGGLPLGNITSGAVDAPYVPAAAIIGELGMLSITALIAVALVELPRNAKRITAPTVAIVAVVVVAGSMSFTQRIGDLDVATVQGGGPQSVKVDQQRPDLVFESQVRETAKVSTADLIIWPENVVTVSEPVEATYEGAVVASLARSKGAYIAAGVVERNRINKTFRNALVVWSPDGNIISRYEKRQRVPFGEYVPARRVFDGFADLSQVPYDAIAGTDSSAVAIDEDRNIKAAVAISYEGLFSRLVADGVRAGGNIVVIPTNAASYEDPAVAQTQIRGARMRAFETQRSVAQAAPTGISALIDNNATLLTTSRVGEARVLNASLPLTSGNTPFVAYGQWPLLSVASLATLWALVRNYKSGRKTGAPVKSV